MPPVSPMAVLALRVEVAALGGEGCVLVGEAEVGAPGWRGASPMAVLALRVGVDVLDGEGCVPEGVVEVGALGWRVASPMAVLALRVEVAALGDEGCVHEGASGGLGGPFPDECWSVVFWSWWSARVWSLVSRLWCREWRFPFPHVMRW